MKSVILHSSDTYGFLMPTDYQNEDSYDAPISLSRVNSVVKSEKEEYGADNVPVTDNGGCLQGPSLASYTQKSPEGEGLRKFTEAYNEVGYDACALGNHDFNYGLDCLSYCVDNSRAPFINDNVLGADTNIPFFGREYTIIEKAGLKIGIIGITTQYISHWESEDHIKSLKFVSGYEVLARLVEKLCPQVDILYALHHGGFESDPLIGKATEPHTGENEGYKILTEIPKIDVSLIGHQHRRLNLVTRNMTIVRPGYRGEAVGKVIIGFDKDTSGKVKISEITTELIDNKDYAPDPAVKEIVKSLDEEAQKWLDQPIAHLSEPTPIDDAIKGEIEGTPSINLIQQIQLWFTGAGVLATTIMSESAHGSSKNVAMHEILLNYPYVNQLCIVKLTGKELRGVIEYSARFLEKDKNGKIKFIDRWITPKPMLYHFSLLYPVKYKADLSGPVGHRLTKVALNRKDLEDDKVYKLAVNNYRVLGGKLYPAYSMDKIERIFGQDCVQMFSEYLTHGDIKVDTAKDYKFH